MAAGSTAARRNRRTSRARKNPHASRESSADKVAQTGDPASSAAASSVEPEALSVTHWFESGTDGDPFAATVQFNGRRHGFSGKPSAGDTFLKKEVIDPVVPGSGPVSVTTWVYGLNPGQWTVTAELIRGSSQIGRVRSGTRRGASGGGQSLPRAAWAWRRWKLSNGSFTPVSTRWAPLVRLGRMPAVIPGAWSGLVGLGVLVGVLVQAALLARDNVPLLSVLTVDLVALLSGLLGAKLLYVALRPRSWRQSIGEGWSVDGFLVVMPIVALAALLAFGLPPGLFLDGSAPALFFGVAIGRLGCFFTGCCAGRCTRSRWGVWSSDRRIGARRIPTQLLESAAGLLIGGAGLLLVVGDPPRFGGIVFLASLAAYVLARQLLLRLRAEPHNRLRAQLTAGLAILVLVGAVAALLLG